MQYNFMEKMTTIQISKRTRKLLEELKAYPGEPMDSIITRIAEKDIDDEPLSEEEIEGIRRGLKDIEEGRVYPMKHIKKRFGI